MNKKEDLINKRGIEKRTLNLPPINHLPDHWGMYLLRHLPGAWEGGYMRFSLQNNWRSSFNLFSRYLLFDLLLNWVSGITITEKRYSIFSFPIHKRALFSLELKQSNFPKKLEGELLGYLLQRITWWQKENWAELKPLMLALTACLLGEREEYANPHQAFMIRVFEFYNENIDGFSLTVKQRLLTDQYSITVPKDLYAHLTKYGQSLDQRLNTLVSNHEDLELLLSKSLTIMKQELSFRETSSD